MKFPICPLTGQSYCGSHCQKHWTSNCQQQMGFAAPYIIAHNKSYQSNLDCLHLTPWRWCTSRLMLMPFVSLVRHLAASWGLNAHCHWTDVCGPHTTTPLSFQQTAHHYLMLLHNKSSAASASYHLHSCAHIVSTWYTCLFQFMFSTNITGNWFCPEYGCAGSTVMNLWIAVPTTWPIYQWDKVVST